MKNENMNCLRCGVPLEYLQRETIQLGQTSLLFGDLGNLLSGGLDVTIMACPVCGELSFFRPPAEDGAVESGLRKNCPQCGRRHHIADRRCPGCGYEYD